MKISSASIYRILSFALFGVSLFAILILLAAFCSGQLMENFFENNRLLFVGLCAAPLGVVPAIANTKTTSQSSARFFKISIRYQVLATVAVSVFMVLGYLYSDAISRSIHTAAGPVVLRGEQTITCIFLSDGGVTFMCAVVTGLTLLIFSLGTTAASTGVVAVLPDSLQRRIVRALPTFRKWL